MATLLQDLRYGLRGLANARGLSAIVLLTVALGTGVNATVFSVMNALLFRPPPGVPEPGALVTLHGRDGRDPASPPGRSSYDEYCALTARAGALQAVAATRDDVTSALQVAPVRVNAQDSSRQIETRQVSARQAGAQQVGAQRRGAQQVDASQVDTITENVRVASVTGTFFPMLALQPAAGRLLAPSDETSGDAGAEAAAPAVIRYDLWQRLFNGNPRAIGQPIAIDDRPYVIVGVTPPLFKGLHLGRPCDVWTPLAAPASEGARGARELSIVGRLRAGLGVHDAQRELDRLANEAMPPRGHGRSDDDPTADDQEHATRDRSRAMVALPYSQVDPALRAQAALIAVVVLGATGLVLLIACANVASLLLSRATARGGEMAIRFALGASRGRLVRQLLTESLLMALAGGALGVLFASWMTDIVPALFAPGEAEMLDTRIDARVFAFTAAISAGAGLLFGLAPAVQTTRQLPAIASRGEVSGISDALGASRIRAVLVIVQVALSCVLLIATGLLVRSLQDALRADLGVIARRIAVVSIQAPGAYDDMQNGAGYERLALEHARKVPGVEAAAWVSVLPLDTGSHRTFHIVAEQDAEKASIDRIDVDINVVSPGYFDTLRLPLLAGRHFDWRDGVRAPLVAIVDDELAWRYFEGAAVGRRLRDPNGKPVEIVGVVKSGRYRTLQEAPRPVVYQPLSQSYSADVSLVARGIGDPEITVAAVRQRLQALDSDVVIRRAMTLDAYLSEALASDTLTTTLVGTCGLLAAILAMVGVYGVMTDAVARRTREIGVRVALGARPSHVVRLVFSEGLRLTTTGVLLGLAGTAGVAHLLRSRLHVAGSLDATTFALLPAALLVLALLAALVPAYRAVRVDPLVVLRQK